MTRFKTLQNENKNECLKYFVLERHTILDIFMMDIHKFKSLHTRRMQHKYLIHCWPIVFLCF